MIFRDYVVVMAVATAVAWLSWVVVLVAINPIQSGLIGFLFFFLTLAMALVGTFSLAGAGARVWLKQEELVSRHVSRSFRQAFLFTLLFIVSLLLLSADLFRWWTVGLLILVLACVELAFVASDRPRTR